MNVLKGISLTFVTAAFLLSPMLVNAGEKHPEMHKSKHHLNEAIHTLEKSAHDYSGHRVKAIELVKQAIAEIEAGLAADKK